MDEPYTESTADKIDKLFKFTTFKDTEYENILKDLMFTDNEILDYYFSNRNI